MSNAPIYHINPDKFWHDPYPDLASMRNTCPIAYVPELDATLITKHKDIKENEKNVQVFSSWQPQGLMTQLMGENLMRKDGRAHMQERKAIYPTMSPKAVQTIWREQFTNHSQTVIQQLTDMSQGDLFWKYAMPVSALSLCSITGLTNMSPEEMNRVSQGMIDGCANYTGDPTIEDTCKDCTASIDQHIDEKLDEVLNNPNASLLSVQLQAGLTDAQIRANIKLSISGGQNEPRDAIAGTIWALLTHPEQLALIFDGKVSWLQAFEEYCRWISPIGMSPRRVAQLHTYADITFEPEDRVFFMFGSGNRDEDIFNQADSFDITRDIGPSLSFGAGPHYCAGAWASRTLIADVALPEFFEHFQNPVITEDVNFGGWAFRGPLSLHCKWG